MTDNTMDNTKELEIKLLRKKIDTLAMQIEALQEMNNGFAINTGILKMLIAMFLGEHGIANEFEEFVTEKKVQMDCLPRDD